MTLEVKWTDEAQIQFKEILDYWEQRNGSSTYSKKLINLFDHSILRLSQFPHIGRQTDNKRIRLKIVKDYFLYYSFNKNQLIVLGISDMRRNPKYLKAIMKNKKTRP